MEMQQNGQEYRNLPGVVIVHDANNNVIIAVI